MSNGLTELRRNMPYNLHGLTNHTIFVYVPEDGECHPVDYVYVDGKFILNIKAINDDIEYESSEELDSFLKQFKINS